MRSARSRTWLADSSPVTYSTVPALVARAATSSRRVDLPAPGSPATRTTAPGTLPPPRTRPGARTPVARARAVSTSTSAIGWAATTGRAAAAVRTVVAPASATVPQAWHSPQRPTHLAVVQPHSEQRKLGRAVLVALMTLTLAAPADTTADGRLRAGRLRRVRPVGRAGPRTRGPRARAGWARSRADCPRARPAARSEEHTSELQS